MPTVSVILPSLNVAAYIEKCLDSVQNQTLQEIEIICVDAGSTDGTAEIIREHEAQDSRIRYIVSDKRSYGYQVNLGMSHATGEYLTILDTDDMIRVTMYEELYRLAKEQDADFVKAGYAEFGTVNGVITVKKEVAIVPDAFLHRVLEVSKHAECFDKNITATWSGIYKKEFLDKYQIRHNETPGASYQDTGFWFQTYAFAKRGYFIDKSFYMYRTDNPNSSVVNRGKVYCICDEYEFLRDKLAKEKVSPEVWDIFYYIFYHKYNRNLERISKEFHEEFMERFAADFILVQKQGYLRLDAWKQRDRETLLQILSSPKAFYKGVLEARKAFVDNLKSREKLIIYGAGKIGKMLLHELRDRENVVAFAVTQIQQSEAMCEGIPIREMDELAVKEAATPIVVAVKSEKMQNELEQFAKEKGFLCIIKVPIGIFDFD